MSKLQKALGLLRESQKNAEEGGAPQSGAQAQSAPALAEDGERAPIRVRSRAPDEASGPPEIVPDMRISIDQESLKQDGLMPRDEHQSLISQQFRRIKRPVLNSAFGLGVPEIENANVIMVASALPKCGKSFCTVNLAASIARERDTGAVVVDADVLKPNISNAFGLVNHKGLIDYLLDPDLRIEDILVATDWFDSIIVPAGRQHSDATELLASRRMEQFISQLSERFSRRAVIVDTPPLLVTNEAHVLAEHMGQIVFVVESGVSTRDSVIEALSSLNRNKPINAILNKAHGIGMSEYFGSSYQYYADPRGGSRDESPH